MFRFIGRLYFWLVLVPYFLRILKPVIAKQILENGREYLTPDATKYFERRAGSLIRTKTTE